MGKQAAATAGAPRRREAALQARWAAGEWRGHLAQASDGASYTIVHQGRPGGGAGPDFRDAVLARADLDTTKRIYGDIELHLRASDWRAHGHAHDPRYNNLALHVIFDDIPPTPDTPQTQQNMTQKEKRKGKLSAPMLTILASGRRIPQAHLTAQPIHTPTGAAPLAIGWPCATFATQFTPAARRDLLLTAGLARFTEKASALLGELHQTGMIASAQGPPSAGSLSNLWPNRRQPFQPFQPFTDGDEQPMNRQPMRASWSQADRVLWLTLAEGLGYGRDRAALRALGEALLPAGDNYDAPHQICWENAALQRVERLRLRGLLAWRLRWQIMGPWAALRQALEGGDSDGRDEGHGASPAERAVKCLLAALRVGGGAVSLGRAIILAANIALPFAAAWASATGDAALAALARAAFLALPGAPSNQITREMMRQLGLRQSPHGAAAQQGLHHLWASHCRMKQCAHCPCAGFHCGDKRSYTPEGF